MQVRPDLPLHFGRISLDPPEDRGVVNLNATVQQHELKITIADREHQIPPDRPQDHLSVELSPFERLILPYAYCLSTSCHAVACS